MEVIRIDDLDKEIVKKNDAVLRRYVLAEYGHFCPSEEEFDSVIDDQLMEGLLEKIRESYAFLGDVTVSITKHDLYVAHFKRNWLESERSKLCVG